MESDKPPHGSSDPSVEFVLDRPASELKNLELIVQEMIKGAVEFIICDPGIMKVLNSRWRKINRPTDVLTFDLSSDEDRYPAGVVYVDGRMAPPLTEVLERVFHGYLHLCGWTHDTEKDAEEMNARTQALVREAVEITEKEYS
ncbi:rRNA maturation RNase YbeY [Candidatus Fermentibacteria bacterium]|nr:MAG: rRNA maturation RNase YbeY [Candidatus Fermentibacteria bacterium]